jgi:hypothetical protein
MLSILSRLAAAVVGGYTFTIVASVSLSSVLPMPRADAVLTAILLSFAVYAGAILWAFSTRTARRAWVGLAFSSTIFACLAWLTRATGAP